VLQAALSDWSFSADVVTRHGGTAIRSPRRRVMMALKPGYGNGRAGQRCSPRRRRAMFALSAVAIAGAIWGSIFPSLRHGRDLQPSRSGLLRRLGCCRLSLAAQPGCAVAIVAVVAAIAGWTAFRERGVAVLVPRPRVEPAASVRTLAPVEVMFAQGI